MSTAQRDFLQHVFILSLNVHQPFFIFSKYHYVGLLEKYYVHSITFYIRTFSASKQLGTIKKIPHSSSCEFIDVRLGTRCKNNS